MFDAKLLGNIGETRVLLTSSLHAVAPIIVMLFINAGSTLAAGPISANGVQATLPKFKSARNIYYPDKAKRLGLEGKVLIAFDITVDGLPTNGAVISSDDELFTKAATEYITNLRFEVPQGDTASGSSLGRYRIGFVFCLPPSALDDTFAVPAFPVVISGSRIPGSPIRHPPAPDASGQCARVR